MTAQIPDILIHRGEHLSLCATPLDDYYSATRKRRPRFVRPSTACYRGYLATWEIREGKVYLVGIEGHLARGRKEVTCVPADLATLFPGLEPPILATWISGELRCPEGALRSGSAGRSGGRQPLTAALTGRGPKVIHRALGTLHEQSG